MNRTSRSLRSVTSFAGCVSRSRSGPSWALQSQRRIKKAHRVAIRRSHTASRSSNPVSPFGRRQLSRNRPCSAALSLSKAACHRRSARSSAGSPQPLYSQSTQRRRPSSHHRAFASPGSTRHSRSGTPSPLAFAWLPATNAEHSSTSWVSRRRNWPPWASALTSHAPYSVRRAFSSSRYGAKSNQ